MQLIRLRSQVLQSSQIHCLLQEMLRLSRYLQQLLTGILIFVFKYKSNNILAMIMMIKIMITVLYGANVFWKDSVDKSHYQIRICS